MVTVNIDDIQRDLVGYLHRVQAGESLLVLEANLPLAEIKPVSEFIVGVGEPRPFGLCAGEFVVPDDFNAPLSEDILQDFERA
jgi:antitoxin (DNA-binding transcriptional repressor) of toxin-antitoxin stability system